MKRRLKESIGSLSPIVAASIVVVLELISFALIFIYPGFWQALIAIVTLIAVAVVPLQKRVRLGAIVGLILIATIGLALKAGGDFLFIVLVGVLVMLLRIRDVPMLVKALLGASILLISVPIAGYANTFLFELGIQIGIYGAMALGLNVVVGMAGLLDLGYAAFFAIGAYTWAIFASPQAANFIQNFVPLSGNWFYLFLLIAIVTTAVTGILIGLPALRLRGDYLAIVTLGLGEVVRVLANNLDHPVNITNGPQGITPIARPPIDLFQHFLQAVGIPLSNRTDYQFFFYLLVLVIIGVVVLVNLNLRRSKFGRAWLAIREDDIAAKAMGVPMIKTKLIAFATGAAFSGAMGVLFAAQRGFVSPESFTLLASITILGMVVLGGMGSIPGVVLGTAALTILNLDILKSFSEYLNTLRQSDATFLGFAWANLPTQVDPSKFERLVFGLTLILMMIFRPEGLLPEKRNPIKMSSLTPKTAGLAQLIIEPTAPALTRSGRSGSARGAGTASVIRKSSTLQAGDPLLLVQGITKKFGGLVAVNDVNLSIPAVRISAVIGPNGAGKTTFFNILTGMYKPDSGTILFDGRNITGVSPEKIAHLGIARTFQNIRLFAAMTVLENVMVGHHSHTRTSYLATIFRGPRFRKEENRGLAYAVNLLEYMNLDERANELAGNLSYGEQRRLEIARALALEPKLLLLDEPAAGMNPQETEELKKMILRLRDELKISIVLIEHDMSMVMSISEQITVLNYGSVLAEGNPAEIRANPQVIEAYLGKGAAAHA